MKILSFSSSWHPPHQAAPDKDAVACRALQRQSGAHRNAEFQEKWERIIRDWSMRFGKMVWG